MDRPAPNRSGWRAYAAALLATALATAVRVRLDPVIGDDYPFAAYFAATIFVAWFGATGPALLSAALGAVVTVYFYLEPKYTLYVTPNGAAGLALYVFVCAAIVGMSHRMRRARAAAERRTAEVEALHAEAQRQRAWLETTLKCIGDAVIAADDRGDVTFVNAVAESLTGWNAGEAVGRPLSDVFVIVNESTRAPVENPAHRALREGVVVGLANHTVLIARDLAERPIDDSAAPLRDEAGRLLGAVLVFRDITDRRRAENALAERERLYRAVFSQQFQLMAILAPDGTVREVNDTALSTVPGGRDAVVGRKFWDAAWWDGLPEMRAAWPGRLEAAAAAAGPVLSEDEYRVAGGEVRTATAAITAVRDAAGVVEFFIVQATDITDRKRLEDELRKLAADLSDADRRKDEFLATLAHELRNPLAPLRNGLEILRRAERDGQTVEQAREMMERQLSHMVRLVDDLLDVSRITRNKLHLRRERVELAEVLAAAVETSRPLLDEAGLTLSVEDAAEPLPLDADRVRLAQVFANLLNNAAKFTDAGGSVTVGVRRVGDSAEVHVSDTGAGIGEELLPRIFELFTQADRTLERTRGGLGIGLSLVQRLTHMHGGAVRALSDGPGRGSTFVVTLPLSADGGRAAMPAPAARADHVRRKVLIVDDNVDAAESLAMLLEMHGHEVRLAHDGEQGVAAAREFSPDLILMDIGLPRLNGYEACRAIRATPGGERSLIVACTGWGADEDRRRSKEAGFDHHLVKPVDADEVEALPPRRVDGAGGGG